MSGVEDNDTIHQGACFRGNPVAQDTAPVMAHEYTLRPLSQISVLQLENGLDKDVHDLDGIVSTDSVAATAAGKVQRYENCPIRQRRSEVSAEEMARVWEAVKEDDQCF